MSNLHVYNFGDVEWVVAKTAEDACRIGNDELGWGMSEEELAPEQEPDDATMSVWLDPDTGGVSSPDESALLVYGEMAAWAEAFGRGWLCTTEY